MTDVQEFFMSHARVSRKTLAHFAEVEVGEVDVVADDLGFGPLLRLDEAEEVLTTLEEDDVDDDAQGPADDDDVEDGDAEDE